MTCCPVCGSGRRWLRYKGNISGRDLDPENYACTASSIAKYHDILTCQDCGLTYSGYRASEEALVGLYSRVVDSTYEAGEGGRTRTFSSAVDSLNCLCPSKGQLLEIGSYTGIFLDLARQQGWDVCGVEFSEWARRMASEKRGIASFSSVDEILAKGPACFDSVVMWDVVEHVPDPRRLLMQAHRAMKPGGLLGLSTIILDSLSAKLLRSKYPFLMEMHLIYFTRNTLETLLKQCGFEIVVYRRHRRYVSCAYALGKYAFSRPLKRIPPLWRYLSRRWFVSSVGLRDVFARKVA